MVATSAVLEWVNSINAFKSDQQSPELPPLRLRTATNRKVSDPGPLRFHAAATDKLAVLAV